MARKPGASPEGTTAARDTEPELRFRGWVARGGRGQRTGESARKGLRSCFGAAAVRIESERRPMVRTTVCGVSDGFRPASESEHGVGEVLGRTGSRFWTSGASASGARDNEARPTARSVRDGRKGRSGASPADPAAGPGAGGSRPCGNGSVASAAGAVQQGGGRLLRNSGIPDRLRSVKAPRWRRFEVAGGGGV
jgi:hypothetical protein